jgi:hypothetical protein
MPGWGGPGVLLMAQMIPDRLPSSSSKGEQRLFAILQRLPDDYIVYYEPVIAERYPDFVLIAPDLGVMVIEVKGWNPSDILDGNRKTIRVRDRGIEKNADHPVLQARTYQLRLQDECRKSREAVSLLLHKDGPHQGNFVFPFSHFAVLSNLTSEQLKGHRSGDLTTIFSPKSVLTRDGLLRWEQLSGKDVRQELKAFFAPWWPIARLTPRQVDVLRGIIHPEIRIESQLNPEQLAVLDLRQERHARGIGDGHRVIRGVAGSGKTVLLIARAKMLSEQSPGAQILVLCYNVSLAAYLRSVLASYRNLGVFHFDGWSKDNGVVRRRGTADEESESNESLGARLTSHLEAGHGGARQFDSVLVDEVHDFDPSWFQCVLKAMKDPDDGDLLIVGDRHQSIYKGRPFSWSSVGIKAVGRTIHSAFDLDKNYRNSREILELAAAFALDREESAEDQLGIVPVDPEKSLRATGVTPMLIRCRTRQDEHRRVIAIVKTLLHPEGSSGNPPRNALNPSQIGILYRSATFEERPLIADFIRNLNALAPAVWLTDGNPANRYRVDEPGIKVQTIHSSKGLQYKAVILLWADQLPRGNTTPELAAEAKLMYVALTRPEDYLFITYSRTSGFIDWIRESGRVTSC